MAIIEPNSEIYLLKSDIELDDNNQLDFATRNAQFNYFNSLPKISMVKCTYQRRNDVIRYEGRIEDILGYNYCMYRNKNHGNKWFYAFITDMTYENDETTYISIKEDSWQTWMFDLNFKQSFVERECVNDDTIGKHTLPEGLELGEFQIVDLRDIPYEEYSGDKSHWVVCFAVSALPQDCFGAVDGRVKGDAGLLGGVFNALKYFAVDSIDDAKTVIQAYERAGVTPTSEAIVNMYMIPRDCVNFSTTPEPTLLTWSEGQLPTPVIHSAYLYPVYNYAYSSEHSLQEPIYLADGYLPTNNKLYTSPFSYIYMSNNAGTEITLDWQDFPIETIAGYTMPTITYYRYYVPTASLSTKLIFENYKNYVSDATPATQMVNYGIPFSKAPICAWTTDYYTNWLTQNGVNNETQITNSILGAVGSVGAGFLTGGLAGATIAGIGATVGIGSTIGNVLAEQHRASTTPPQAQGEANSADLTFTLKRNSISCYFMSVRREIAEIIDKYFSMFGYKVNIVKIPNITGRRNWNYVKTIGCNITGDIPQTSLAEIRGFFDSGITIWHNPATFRDYSQENNII